MIRGRKEPVDPRNFLPLHPLEARILLILSEGETHGYRIVKEIELRDAGWTRIFPANLYRRMRDLLARGWIEIVGTASDDSGRTRKTFRITELGSEVAAAEGKRLEALVADFRAASFRS